MDILVKLFERDLNALINELTLFKNEEDVWKVLPGVSNSSGNLTLHLVGNLQHFIGGTLGNTGYVRDREAEFSNKNISREVLITNIKNTIDIIKQVLPSLTEEQLHADFPLQLNNQVFKTNYFLHHLMVHLSYHLGQVNYLRRVL